MEKRYLRKDGSILWAILTVSGLSEDDEGNMTNIAIAQDITERKRMEQNVLESEIKFRTLFEQAGVGVLQADASTGRFLKINKKLADMLGYSIDELMQLTFQDITPPDHIEKSVLHHKQLFTSKARVIATEKKYIRKDGTSVWGELTLSTMSESTSCKEFHIAVIQDITERKNAEQELIKSEGKFKTVFNQSPIGLELYDMNGKLLDCNPACLDLFGINEINEVVGFNLFNDPNLSEEQKIKIKNGENVRFEVKFDFEIVKNLKLYTTSRSGIAYFSCFATTFREYGEENDGILLQLIEITERKKAEQALKTSETQLKELNDTKDKFFSIIAHDLKNPFTVLKTSSELLEIYLAKKDFEKSQAKTAMIVNASRHGYALLENLLAWAKSQTGGIKFEPRKMHFRSNVDKNIMEVEDHAIEKNIIIKNEIPEDVIIKADENLLSVVFRNLLTNAIKFTHSGGTITINAKINSNSVEVAVIDTGIGIPKEHQHKLFRLDTNFSRVGTANESSTSLGLILCKEFIEKHNGRIWVESEANKGSEFRFILPLDL